MSHMFGPKGEKINLGALSSVRTAPNEIYDKKATPPKTGNAFGSWAGRDIEYATAPGGATIGFNLNQLTLADFRQMRDHYQINSSLAVLTFMQHQSDWSIECEDEKIAKHCEEEIRRNWTGLNRGFAQSNWAGFSPMVLEWANEGSKTLLDKVKDLIPEECEVNWKFEDGWAPPGKVAPKFKTYDGIKQFGTPWPIPTENTIWYPMLMENGNYYGRNLLRPAFQSWYFSLLMHVYANRYYERFGEPVPVGRAPYDDNLTLPDGKSISGSSYMAQMLNNLRNRSVVVLPNDRAQGADGKDSFEYQLEYMESQMRGADFERYMTRLDEEMSLGLFTPILLLRTADVGSYNLGVGHMQMYLWMLNAMNDDRKVYMDKYLLSKMVDYNFGPNAPRARIKFRKLGNTDATMLKEIVAALIQGGKAGVNLEELGSLIGLDLTEVRESLQPAVSPNEDPDEEAGDGDDDAAGDDDSPANRRARARRAGLSTAHAVTTEAIVKEIRERVAPQVANIFAKPGARDAQEISLGFKRRMVQAVGHDRADYIYNFMDTWTRDVLPIADSADEFMRMMDDALTILVS